MTDYDREVDGRNLHSSEQRAVSHPYPSPAGAASEKHRLELQPDCGRCCGLCCVAPVFSVSADFAIAKKAGEPCPHLESDFRCSIHHRLRAEGFPGCVAYDCFGAGQKVTQLTFEGRNWRQSREIAAQMFDTFSVMRQLHSLMKYLVEALALPLARPLHRQLTGKLEQVRDDSLRDPETLSTLDVGRHAAEVEELLLRVSELVRASDRPSGKSGNPPVEGRAATCRPPARSVKKGAFRIASE